MDISRAPARLQLVKVVPPASLILTNGLHKENPNIYHCALCVRRLFRGESTRLDLLLGPCTFNCPECDASALNRLNTSVIQSKSLKCFSWPSPPEFLVVFRTTNLVAGDGWTKIRIRGQSFLTSFLASRRRRRRTSRRGRQFPWEIFQPRTREHADHERSTER